MSRPLQVTTLHLPLFIAHGVTAVRDMADCKRPGDPFGLIPVDGARVLDPRAGEPMSRYVFSMGHAFEPLRQRARSPHVRPAVVRSNSPALFIRWR